MTADNCSRVLWMAAKQGRAGGGQDRRACPRRRCVQSLGPEGVHRLPRLSLFLFSRGGCGIEVNCVDVAASYSFPCSARMARWTCVLTSQKIMSGDLLQAVSVLSLFRFRRMLSLLICSLFVCCRTDASQNRVSGARISPAKS